MLAFDTKIRRNNIKKIYIKWNIKLCVCVCGRLSLTASFRMENNSFVCILVDFTDFYNLFLYFPTHQNLLHPRCHKRLLGPHLHIWIKNSDSQGQNLPISDEDNFLQIGRTQCPICPHPLQQGGELKIPAWSVLLLKVCVHAHLMIRPFPFHYISKLGKQNQMPPFLSNTHPKMTQAQPSDTHGTEEREIQNKRDWARDTWNE